MAKTHSNSRKSMGMPCRLNLCSSIHSSPYVDIALGHYFTANPRRRHGACHRLQEVYASDGHTAFQRPPHPVSTFCKPISHHAPLGTPVVPLV